MSGKMSKQLKYQSHYQWTLVRPTAIECRPQALHQTGRAGIEYTGTEWQWWTVIANTRQQMVSTPEFDQALDEVEAELDRMLKDYTAAGGDHSLKQAQETLSEFLQEQEQEQQRHHTDQSDDSSPATPPKSS